MLTQICLLSCGFSVSSIPFVCIYFRSFPVRKRLVPSFVNWTWITTLSAYELRFRHCKLWGWVVKSYGPSVLTDHSFYISTIKHSHVFLLKSLCRQVLKYRELKRQFGVSLDWGEPKSTFWIKCWLNDMILR